jgi:hypothetical protein
MLLLFVLIQVSRYGLCWPFWFLLKDAESISEIGMLIRQILLLSMGAWSWEGNIVLCGPWTMGQTRILDIHNMPFVEVKVLKAALTIDWSQNPLNEIPQSYPDMTRWQGWKWDEISRREIGRCCQSHGCMLHSVIDFSTYLRTHYKSELIIWNSPI